MSQSSIDDLIKQYQDKLSQVGPPAVGSNLLLWSGVSVATVLVFNLLRPRNKIIYEPKVKYHEDNKQPPNIKSGFFDWLSPLIHTHEPTLVDKIGLDAVAYLRFLRMLRWLFLCLALLACAVLLPINIVATNASKDPNVNALSRLTIQSVNGQFLYAHIIFVYIATFLTLGFTWFNWKKMVELRMNWFRSDEYNKSFYARTLMILSVPKNMQSDEGLTSLFQSLQVPYPTTSVVIGRKVGQLPDLIEYHNETVKALERVLVRYLRGGKIAKKRPTITVGGCLGLGGTKKDAIEFYTNKLKRTEQAIENWRNKIDLKKAENYGFASMAAVPYAHIVAQMLQNKRPKGTIISLAPNPKDIIWSNLDMSEGDRARQQLLGWLWLLLATIVNIIPLLVVSMFANLSEVTEFTNFPFLRSWQSDSPLTFSIANGVLPPTLSAIFAFFFPVIMRWVSKYQGAVTNSRLDRAVVARYFAFLVVSQFFIFSLIGVVFKLVVTVVHQLKVHTSFEDIIRNAHDLPRDIQSTYVSQSSYWLTFFPLRGFLAVFDLAQLLHLVWTWILTRLFGRTPRDIREWTQPPNFDYAIYYSNILFMAVVGLIYAPLAPLVTLSAAVVFWISSVVYKYQLMFVFVTSVETGGRMWNVIINRLLAGLIFMQLLMVLTIGLGLGWISDFTWISTVPPILITIIFKIYLSRTFGKQFRHYVPDSTELSKSLVHSAGSDHRGHRIEKRFGHPALMADLFTPLVHAKMMELLPQVYHGRLSEAQASVDELGGQKLDAQVTASGIKIAAVSQHDLEVDPSFYQRDRGELSDRRSIASAHQLSHHHSKSSSLNAFGGGKPTGYHQYLAHGTRPSAGNEMELHRLDSVDNLPLLDRAPSNFSEASSIYKSQAMSRSGTPQSQWGPPAYASQSSLGHEAPRYQTPPPIPTTAMRVAPTHRPMRQGGSIDALEGYPPRGRTPDPNDPRFQQPIGQYPPSRHQTPDPYQQVRQRTPDPYQQAAYDPYQQSRRTPDPYQQQQQVPRGRTPDPYQQQAPRGRTPDPYQQQQQAPRGRTPDPYVQQAPRGRTPDPYQQQAPRGRTPDPYQQQQPRGQTPDPYQQQPRGRTPDPYQQQGSRSQTPEQYHQQAPRRYTPDPYQQPNMGHHPNPSNQFGPPGRGG